MLGRAVQGRHAFCAMVRYLPYVAERYPHRMRIAFCPRRSSPSHRLDTAAPSSWSPSWPRDSSRADTTSRSSRRATRVPAVPRRSLYAHAQWPPEMLADINHVSWALHEVGRGRVRYRARQLGQRARLLARDANAASRVHAPSRARRRFSGFYRFFPDAWYVAISRDQARREIPLPHLDVIHHGLDGDKYQWTESPCEYVCFVGRFTAVKGPHVAIDVAAQAGVPIRVAGEVHSVDADFGSREMSHRLAARHVTMLGSIGMDEKVPLLRDARAVLAPITWDEPFGLALIEAMLSGCPVIAFPRGSVPELVENGVTGFVVRDAIEMRELVQPGSVLDQFDRAAMSRARRRAFRTRSDGA